ncbi:MAG: bifunctional folylpolyglutamate synthase/dihydrofolate synthase [Oscillospiraceae bacterium]|nr:bifunctional folylpolyglutamate synthase/dihydrofolate synthase [Oscillospiraceae bacterium]
MDYEESLEYIANFPRFKKEPSLDEMKMLLAKLGDPQNRLKSINVAGTNGKGSTVAMLSSVLSTAGYKTGRYISPYVLEFRERMMINGKMIGKKRLAKIVETVKEKADELMENGIVLNAFEVTTACAMLWFAEEECDFVVLEAGLGGRFDATNTVPEPVLQIITAVGLDHMEQLGDTVAKITAEKCGILRPGCTLLTSPGQEQEALTVMLNKCAELDATFVTGAAGRAKIVSCDASGMDVLVGKTELSLSLGGRHQINNLLTVYSAVSILKEKHFVIKDEHLVEGIAATKFPARFELCSKEPMVILDGAHNPQAAKALVENVKEFLPEKRTLLCGMMADKDCETVMAELAPCFERIITVPVQNPRMVLPEKLAEIAAKYCKNVKTEQNAKEALESVLEKLESEEALVVAGSLYLASELRPMLMRYKGNPKAE